MENIENDEMPRGSALRCFLVWLCATAGLVLLAAFFAHTTVESWHTATAAPQRPLLTLGALAGLAACPPLWWTVTTVCWKSARGLTVRAGGLVRRVTLLACGMTLSLGVTAPSFATSLSGLDGLPHPELASVATVSAEPTPEPTREPTPAFTGEPTREPTAERSTPARPAESIPDRPKRARPHLTLPTRPQPHPTGAETYVVTAGDSLWRIAEQHSTPAPQPGSVRGPERITDVAAAVRALHRANRDVIGDNPNLIHPGQVLTVPSTTTHQEQR